MTVLSPEIEKAYKEQQDQIAQCANYYYGGFNATEIAQFDSIAINPESRPDLVKSLFDSIGESGQANIDTAVRWGIEQYQARNGGELPHPSVIASALGAGLQASKINADSLSKAIDGFDSINNLQYEQASIVPALTVATIANVIAYALPIFALIPNNNQSVKVPLVAMRFITDSAFGAMAAGDYLDGENAAKPYAEGRFRFAMVKGVGNTYSVVAHTCYDDFKAKTPNTATPLLPFWSGLVSVKINGMEVGHTRDDRLLSVDKGQISLIPNQKGVKVGDTVYKVTASNINLDNSSISVTLDGALPNGASIEVALVANFEARDANKKFKLNPVGVSVEAEYDSLVAAPFSMRVNASYSTQSQLANELNLGFVGAALSIMQGKFFLEQTVRLLKEIRERAILNGRGYFDMSRGVTGNLSAVANTTGDLFAEVLKVIKKGKRRIRRASGGATTSFDLYVGDNGEIFFTTLSADKFTPTGVSSTYGEIVRIGTLADGTDVYHTPNAQGVIEESDDNKTFEMLLLGKGNEPVRNPLVGHIPNPPVVREAFADTRELVMDIHGKMAAELNPLERYADQCALLQVVNAPAIPFDPPAK